MLWQDKQDRRFTSFIVTDKALLATGHPGDREDLSFMASIDPKTGKDHWIVKIPANAVKGGASIDHRGRIYVATENGQLICYSAQKP